MNEHKELGSFIDRTYKVVRQVLINRLKASDVDITPEQWMILSKLDGGNVRYQTEIANISFKDKPTGSRILDFPVKTETGDTNTGWERWENVQNMFNGDRSTWGGQIETHGN